MERLPTTDNRGRMRHEVKRWIDVINRGNLDAEEMTVESTAEGVFLASSERPRTLHAGQSQRFGFDRSLVGGDATFRVTWKEKGEEREKVFDA